MIRQPTAEESIEELFLRLLTLLSEAAVVSVELEERVGESGIIIKTLTPGLPDLSNMDAEGARKAASQWLAEAQRYIESGGFIPESAAGRFPPGITRDLQFVIERVKRLRERADFAAL